MFNKPSTAPRNDTIVRKDVRTILGGNGSNVAELGAKAAIEPIAPVTDKLLDDKDKEIKATEIDSSLEARLIVGPRVKLKGAEILDCDTLVVEGRVEATMDSRVIRISDQGSFTGKVSIDIAEIHGKFEGELTARAQLIIHATGKVSGKIRYGKLVIDEGGELCGDINALSAENRSAVRPASESVPTLNAIAG
nr:polymer-forming cytoskeletal protein [Dechloromonas sp.]